MNVTFICGNNTSHCWGVVTKVPTAGLTKRDCQCPECGEVFKLMHIDTLSFVGESNDPYQGSAKFINALAHSKSIIANLLEHKGSFAHEMAARNFVAHIEELIEKGMKNECL